MIRAASTSKLASRLVRSSRIRVVIKNSVTRRQSALLRPGLATGSNLLDLLVNPKYNLLAELNLSVPDDDSGVRILACSSKHDDGLLERAMAKVRRTLQWLWGALVVAARSAEVAIRFSPLAILTPAAIFSKDVFGNAIASDVAWWYTLRTLQALGPAWQKLGQWAATRRDLFPVHVCDRLSALHDHGFSHSWRYTDSVLKETFGADYVKDGLVVGDLIGCGSAAQVYRGTLTDASSGSTRNVAIKVLHPRFASLVERDLVLIKSVANLLHSLPVEALRILGLPRVSENFTVILRNQSDLRIEGENLDRFRRNFYGPGEKDEAKSAVFFPKPIRSERNVLLEDLVDQARPIAEYLKDESKEGWKIREELAGPLLRSFLKMVFIDSWVHCDLHPGNVMVRSIEQGNGKVKRSIVFLDAGIATSLSAVDHQNLLDLFRAVLLNRGYNAGKLMVERAKHERCSQVEGGVHAFAQGVDELVSEFHDRRKSGLTLGAVHIGSLLSRVLDLCRVHGVEIDPSMASIVLSTLVLEGLGRSLQPNMNLMDFALPFVLGRGKV